MVTPASMGHCNDLDRFKRYFVRCCHLTFCAILSGKKSKSVFDFLRYSRETGFSFSYEEVGNLLGLIGPSNEIDRVSRFNNSLSFGAKQNAL